MKTLYERAPERGPGLRLHLNENSAGCSPRVLEAMRAATAEQAACYPDYAGTTEACAAWLGVNADQVLLTNGLDEGIAVAALAFLGRGGRSRPGEAVVIEPAYPLFASSAELAGGRVVRVGPRPDLGFPLDDALRAISTRTRLVFIASPANPSGLLVEAADVRAIAGALPRGAVLFLDEAYVEFASASLLPDLPSLPNLVVGRTFAKAYGLAAVRAGYLVAAPALVERLRAAILPFSVNVFALAGMRAAISDAGFTRGYVAEVCRSRQLIYDACDRLGFACWRSEANFVLVRVGPSTPAIVEALAGRGIFVRDRSALPGCNGCIRITAGLVEQTTCCLDALEALCGAR